MVGGVSPAASPLLRPRRPSRLGPPPRPGRTRHRQRRLPEPDDARRLTPPSHRRPEPAGGHITPPTAQRDHRILTHDLKVWTEAWLGRIGALYRAHSALAAAPDSPQRAQAAEQFDTALVVIDRERHAQAANAHLMHPAAVKVLATLDREWDGLARHREFPELPLDNNAAEVRHEVARDEWTRRGEDQQMMLVA